MAGFGIYSFGLGAFGLGTPATAPEPPSGEAGSRYINPVSKDYENDVVTGQLKQMPKNMQRILLALSTLRTSATAVPRFGTVLPRKMGTTFRSEVELAIRFALSHMTDVEGSIIILLIKVERGRNSRAQATIVYDDLETGETDQRISTSL